MAKPTRFTEEMVNEYMAKGYWTTEIATDFLDQNATKYPNKEALVDSKSRLSWSEAKKWVDRIALGLLELGIKRDEALVAQLPNWIEFYLLQAACEKAGILFVPAQRNFRHSEMERVLKYIEAVGVVIPWEFRGFDYFRMIQEIRSNLPRLKHVLVVGDKVPEGAISLKEMTQQPLDERYPLDYLQRTKFSATEVSIIRLTTGTTGLPKFVESSTCSNLYACKCFNERRNTSSDSVIGIIIPATGGAGGRAYFMAFITGAKLVMLEHFEAEEALKLIERERVTHAFVVPAQLSKMLSNPNLDKFDFSALQCFFCGTAPLNYQLGRESEERMRGKITNTLGGMDMGNVGCTSLDDPLEVRLLTVGKPCPGTEVKLIDDTVKEVSKGGVGEVLVKGPDTPSGYYKDPEATWQAWKDGWYRTGDLGRFDEQENLIIVGRKKEVIIRGGQNIYPTEIEAMLITHPKVSTVAIVPMPDPIMGEKACAYVVPKAGQSFTFEEMVAFLRAKNIAPYKLPERLEIRDELPISGDTLKVLKRALVDDIAKKLKSEG